MIGPPPITLTDSEIARLELVALPNSRPQEEDETVYRFADTGEFIAQSEDEEAAIRAAFPRAAVRRVY